MIYLGIGTNLGNRRENIVRAAALLEQRGLNIARCSPVYETAAYLPFDAKAEWNKPYLNAVLEIENTAAFPLSPFQLLSLVKGIEREMGAEHAEKWAPRIIDIDIVFFDGQAVDAPNLKIPHPGFDKRAFVLDPLSHLCPQYRVPGGKTVLEMAHGHPQHQPILMGIVNLSPDSFSTKGGMDIREMESLFDQWEAGGVQIIDIGAEATNPKVNALSEEDELGRLAPVFELVKGRRRRKSLISPHFSIDTYHASTARKALESGFGLLNDEKGLAEEEMIELASGFGQAVAMHSLGIPARSDKLVAEGADIVGEASRWLEKRAELWRKSGLDLEKVVFDPGIGFGKNASQSLRLIQNIDEANRYGLRNLLGHSRKSFMNVFTSETSENRDIETLGLSLGAKGFDILRVHNPLAHRRAMLAKAHCFNQFFK